MKQQPLYLLFPVWGRRYIDDFLGITIPSLLAPGNLPAVKDRPVRVIVYTTEADWGRMISTELCLRLAKFVSIEAIIADVSQTTGKYTTAARAYQALLARSAKDRALASPLIPDTIFADGWLKTLLKPLPPGKKAMMTPTFRVSYEKLAEPLEFGRPILKVTPRELAALTVQNLHSDFAAFDVRNCASGANIFASPWWTVAEDGFLAHTVCWQPALIDFARIEHHDLTPLDHWTIDGHYTWANVGGADNVVTLNDSDDFMMLGITREAETCAVRPARGETIAQIVGDARYEASVDPLRRALFPTPVFVHGSSLNEKWSWTEREAARIVKESFDPVREARPFIPPPMLVESFYETNFVLYRGEIYKVPQALGELDLATDEHRALPGIIAFPNLDAAKASLYAD